MQTHHPKRANGREYTEKDVQLDAWAAEQGQKPEVHVDDMVEALDPPSRQCVVFCRIYFAVGGVCQNGRAPR